MTTTARTIQAARFAGLILVGQMEDGTPMWMGDTEWDLFEKIMNYEA